MKKLIDRHKKITIGNLLNLDNINGVLSHIEKEKHIDMELIAIWTTKDKEIAWVTNGLTVSRIIYLSEVVKHALLSDE